ncbi:glycosyltransferase family 2 protein [Thermodesulfobacteriota bacterium]
MKSPLISIITSVYNSSSTLQRCIDSVSSQSWPYKEHIIIDGGSNDGTFDIIKNNENKIKYWESKHDRGIYEAWNKGLNHINGEWIIFLGADDTFFCDNVLEKFIKKISELKEIPMLAYGKIEQMDESGISVCELGDTWENSEKKFFTQMNIPHPGCFHHKKLFLQYGLFDEQFEIAGDYDLLLRFAHDFPPVYLPNFMVAKMQIGGISSNPSYFYKNLLESKRAQLKNDVASFSLMWHWRVIKHYVNHLFFSLIKKAD